MTLTTEPPTSRPLTEGIQAAAFPTQSRTRGSLSSRRGWLRACTSLQAKTERDKKLLSVHRG